MRILLDECLPIMLRRDLVGHEVSTVVRQGWLGSKNGLLLRQAASQFDIFLTVDQNMEHQQNLAGMQLAVIVMIAPNTKIATLRSLMPKVLEVLQTIQMGEVVHVQR